MYTCIQVVPVFKIEFSNYCVEIMEIAAFAPSGSKLADDQLWYIYKLGPGQQDGSFIIVSKLNGKALYCTNDGKGLFVRVTERNDNDESQHWTIEDSYIMSKKLKKVFFMRTNQLYLADKDITKLSLLSNENKIFSITELVSLHVIEPICEWQNNFTMLITSSQSSGVLT